MSYVAPIFTDLFIYVNLEVAQSDL